MQALAVIDASELKGISNKLEYKEGLDRWVRVAYIRDFSEILIENFGAH